MTSPFGVMTRIASAWPTEHRVAEDRPDCYWLYVVTDCNAEPKLRTIKDPASYDWRPVQKVQHYTIPARAMTGSE